MALYTNIKGPINYTTVGSPTIVDGVVNGFSSSNYLELQQAIPDLDNNSKLEIFIDCKIENYDSTNVFFGATNGDTFNIKCQIDNKKRLFGYVYNNTTSTRLITPAIWSTSALDNSRFQIKYTISNNVLRVERSIDGGSFYGTEVSLGENFTYTKGIKLCLGKILSGSIDLNETYININGNAWFGTSFSKVKLHSPTAIAYTKIGNPTITSDGVASGFTDKTDYLTLGAFNPGTSKWKFTTKVKIYDYATQISLIDRNSSTRCFQIVVRTTGKFRVNISTNGSSKANEVDGTHVLSTNTIYYVSFEYDGSKYYLKYSLDNINWTTDITINNSTKIYPVSSMCMGHSWYSSGTEKWNGEIYLRWTRFEIDGVTNDKCILHCLEGN